jgi:hypothetical protein
MPAYFVITIDTEEDDWESWQRTGSRVENVQQLSVVQQICDRFGAIPTYLITYPVAVENSSAKLLKKISERGGCEIGAHCHPWNTPPFEEAIISRNTMLCNLPRELQHRKLEKLHEIIVDRLGITPTSFRAGRWASGPGVAASLDRLGYQVDSSVTPYFSWTDLGGPDFSKGLPFPYRFMPDDILSEDLHGSLLELPPSIGFLQKDFDRCASTRRWIIERRLPRLHFLGLLNRLRMLNLRWLSPEVTNLKDMVLLIKRFLSKGYSFLNLMFHSNSLVPGISPFVRNEEDLRLFLNKIRALLAFAAENNFTFLSLTAAGQTYQKGTVGQTSAQEMIREMKGG